MLLSQCKIGENYRVEDKEDSSFYILQFRSAHSYRSITDKKVWTYCFIVLDNGTSENLIPGVPVELEQVDLEDDLMIISEVK